MLVRGFPVLHARLGQAAPQGGMAHAVEAGTGERVMGLAIAAHHVLGGGAHGGQLGIAHQAGIVALHKVDQAQGLGGKAVRQIEARKVQPRAARPGHGLVGDAFIQQALGGQEAAGPQRAPAVEIQETGAFAKAGQGGGRLAQRQLRRGQAKAARTRNGDARFVGLDLKVVGEGRDHQARGTGQKREIDKDALFRHPAACRSRHDGQDIAGRRIGHQIGMARRGQQGGQRLAAGIALVAGQPDRLGGAGHLGADGHLQVAMVGGGGDGGGRLQGQAQDGKALAGDRLHLQRIIPQGLLQTGDIESGCIVQHDPGGQAAHEDRAGARARAVKGDQHAVLGALSIREILCGRGRRLGDGLLGLVARLRRGVVGLGLFLLVVFVFGLFVFGLLVFGLGVPGRVQPGRGFRDCLGLGAGDALAAQRLHCRDLGPPAAGWGIGGAVGLGRQDVEHDMAAVLEIVIAGIGVGFEFHHGGVPVQAPGGILHPGRREAGDHRQVHAHRCLKADGHLSRAGEHRIGHVPGPVENQPGEFGIGAGAQLHLGQAGRIDGFDNRLCGRRQVGHHPVETGRCQIDHGAIALLADMQAHGHGQGKAQRLAVGIGAAGRQHSGHGGGHRRGADIGFAAEGDGQHAAGGDGADLGVFGQGEGQPAITAHHAA